MPRVSRPAPPISAKPAPAAPKLAKAPSRPSRLKLLLRRQRRLVRPALWGATGFTVVLAGVLLAHSAAPGGMLARARVQLAAAIDMPVKTIIINGRKNTPELLLQAALGVRPGEPILGIGLEAARRRIESLSWVQNASIERHLPDTIIVNLTERRPFAIWQHEGRFVLIGRDGEIVTNEEVAKFRDLPLVVGAGAPQAAAALLDGLAEQPALMGRVLAAVRVGERRWNLRLKNGADILLPEGAELAALAKLVELQSTQALLDRPLSVVDMRLGDRLVVRPQTAVIPVPPTAPAPGKKA